MQTKKILVFTLLILLGASTIYAQNLASTWEVQKYEISATLPQNFSSDRDLKAKANLTLKNISDEAYSRLTLRISDQATVKSVRVNNSTADFRKSEENIGGNRKLQRILVTLPSVAPKTSFNVSVEYNLTVKENSGLSALSPIGSQFLPMSFWYPTPNSWYFAAGADFAPVTMKIDGAPNQQIVTSGNLSSNAFESKLNGQPFFTTGQWKKSSFEGAEVYAPVGSAASTDKRAEELANLALEAKNYVGGLFGSSVNFPIKIVAAARGAGFSDGGTIFIDESVFRRDKIDAQTAMYISEGIAKTWLGNIYKVDGNGYGVIREGLSRFVATKFIEKKFGKEVADIERLRQRASYSSIADKDSPLNISSPLDGYFYTSNANKGAIIWRYLAKRIGEQDFYKIIQSQAQNGILNLDELRQAFASEKDYLDYAIDKATEMNLLIGIPQKSGASTKVALRNLGEIPAEVDVSAVSANGQKLSEKVSIPAKSFGEAVFPGSANIVRVEIDPDKIYPQINYTDDVAPRVADDNDELIYIKRDFDRQKYSEAEKKAREVLSVYPNFDDARILLARSLLAQNKITEAQRMYQMVLDEKLPTARSLAWANVGLGEIASKTGQNSEAAKYFEKAIQADAEYGATLSARTGRSKINSTGSVDPSINAFFEKFDKYVTGSDKNLVGSIILSGEISRFAGSVAGQAQQWTTKVIKVDKLDELNALVETNLNIKLLNRNNESGIAVFRLTKVGSEWMLSGVDVFEVK